MRTRGSNQHLKKANTLVDIVEKWEESAVPEIDSWQLKVLAIEEPRHSYWLVDSAANIHIYNDQSLMMEYQEQSTKIVGSTSDRISPERGKVRLRLDLKDKSEGLVINFQKIYYLPQSSCNLVSFELLNISGIYHDDKNKTFYKFKTRQILAQA